MPEYQHRPDQGPGGGERQFLLYMIVAFLLVWTFSSLFLKQPQPQPSLEKAQSKPATAPAEKAAPNAAASQAPAQTTTPARQASSEATTVIENNLYKITFTNRGAQVTSWILKKYKDNEGKPLELVNKQASAKMGLPLSLWTYDENLRNKLNSALYVAQPSAALLSPPATITFEYSGDGVTARKSFSFDHSYVVKVDTSVTQNGNAVQAYPAWPSALGDQINIPSYATSRVDYRTPDGVQHSPAFEKNWIRPNHWVSGGETLKNTFNWAGVSDQFFAAIFMPNDPRSATMVTLHETMPLPKDPSKPNENTIDVHILGAAVGNSSGATAERLFVGPKDIDVLDSIHSNGSDGAALRGPNLENVIDFGFWGIFAKWLFKWLNWTHDHGVPNWGWGIVVLTVIINLALLPLRIKQMHYSLKMQKLQPKIQAIQKKYEKYSMRDPRKAEMQKEIFALQKQEGVSYAGGCLPLLPQLPLIYAFYEMLANTIALRQAPWLWIHDLTAPDPLHILPILTIVSMMTLQQMTPQAGIDPAQRRMMNLFMPLFFGFLTWAVSAGLALYWTLSNVISLGQQFVMNRTHLGREIRELQEKRARKKASK
jgi:YidC/Oxa1 family membrane protein insertase